MEAFCIVGFTPSQPNRAMTSPRAEPPTTADQTKSSADTSRPPRVRTTTRARHASRARSRTHRETSPPGRSRPGTARERTGVRGSRTRAPAVAPGRGCAHGPVPTGARRPAPRPLTDRLDEREPVSTDLHHAHDLGPAELRH